MGCPKHLYNPDQESSPFLRVWKKERLENVDVHFLGTPEEKSRAEKFCYSYLPFGLTFNSSAISPENNYKFQSQERQDETGWDSFKWRNGMPELGRFFNIDPLAEKYYHNSPYAFSENKVTSHVELEGLEAFSVHGVMSSPSGFNDANFSKFIDHLVENYTNNTTQNKDFDWRKNDRGKTLNSLLFNKDDRSQAAHMLADHVMANRAAGEEITLIGFSGGALVSFRAAEILRTKFGVRANVIAVNPPGVRNRNSWDHPYGNKGINDLLVINTVGDPIPGAMFGASSRFNPVDLPTGSEMATMRSNGRFISAHMVKNVNQASYLDWIGLSRLSPVSNDSSSSGPNKKRRKKRRRKKRKLKIDPFFR